MTPTTLKEQSLKDEAAIQALIEASHRAHHAKDAAWQLPRGRGPRALTGGAALAQGAPRPV